MLFSFLLVTVGANTLINIFWLAKGCINNNLNNHNYDPKKDHFPGYLGKERTIINPRLLFFFINSSPLFSASSSKKAKLIDLLISLLKAFWKVFGNIVSFLETQTQGKHLKHNQSVNRLKSELDNVC